MRGTEWGGNGKKETGIIVVGRKDAEVLTEIVRGGICWMEKQEWWWISLTLSTTGLCNTTCVAFGQKASVQDVK